MPTKKPWLVALPVAAALAIFFPLLRSGLGFDELIHLYNLVNFGPVELLTKPHGGHLLFFSNLSYWLLYALVGVQANAYYGLALVTHLANVALCYRVIRELTGLYVVESDGDLLRRLRAGGKTPIERIIVAPAEVPNDALYVPNRRPGARATAAPGAVR